jgi:hypothetical protein
MGTNVLGDAGCLRRFPTSLPEHLRCDRLVSTPVVYSTRKRICLRMHPAPILAQSFQQLRTERHVAVSVPLAMPDESAYARYQYRPPPQLPVLRLEILFNGDHVFAGTLYCSAAVIGIRYQARRTRPMASAFGYG